MFKPNRVFKKPLTIVYSGDPDFLASTTSPPELVEKALVSHRERSGYAHAREPCGRSHGVSKGV
jgi:hypothetical protein